MTNLLATLDAGRRHHQSGEFPRAEQLYRQVLRADPFNAEAALLAAAVCKDQKKLTEAHSFLQKALGIRPNYPEAHNARALMHASQGELNEALEALGEALRLRPEYAEAHHNMGVTLARSKRLDEAITAFRKAIRIKPDYADALLNLARGLEEQGKLDEAIAAYKKALPLRANDAAVHNSLGLLLARRGRTTEAVEEFRQAVKLNPNNAPMQNNLAVGLSELGQPENSLEHFENAVRLQPDHAEAHKSRALTWLHLGDFERGWAEYEWRLKCKDGAGRTYRQPTWDGTALEGRRILLYTEQGVGDTFQFIRYAPLLAERGGVVIVECPGTLVPILHSCPGISRLVAHGSPLPDFECHSPLMSLPRLLGTSLATVPAKVPYLAADPKLVERWQRELAGVDGLKIGIVWQGNPGHGGDARRSFPLNSLAALARVPGARLFSLQKGKGTEQLTNVLGEFPVVDIGGRLDFGSFTVTAAAMHVLDLVISCDTSCAHLAGALGRPVWTVLSFANEWRWLKDRSDTPWYPTMRLFRQPKLGDWNAVFDQMTQELARLTPPSCPLAT